MIAVVGISSSSKAELDRVLDALGTNVLTATKTQGFSESPPLPTSALESVLRQDEVESAAAVGTVEPSGVYRNPFIPAPADEGHRRDGGLGRCPRGPGAARSPRAAGSTTARRPAAGGARGRAARRSVWNGATATRASGSGGRWVQVVGVLAPLQLAEDLDNQVFVPRASPRELGFDGAPTAVYTRVDPGAGRASRDVLAGAIRPGAPQDVGVTRPSDALAAKDATDDSFTGLLVGIGGVALLVGGIGVANTMVITVLERRAEVGVRRALGARRRNIRDQFLVESLLLSFVGGIAGVVIGVGVTVAFALGQGWPVASRSGPSRAASARPS